MVERPGGPPSPGHGGANIDTLISVAGWTPRGWASTSAVEMISPDGALVLGVACDRIHVPVTLDAYADHYEGSILPMLGDTTATPAQVAPFLGSQPTRTRVVTWSSGDTHLTTMLAFAVCGGWGLRCHATGPSDTFADRLDEFVCAITALRFPCSPATAGVDGAPPPTETD